MEFIVSISGLTRSTILKHGNRSPHARSVLRECATPADIAPVAGFFPTELARRAGLTHTTVAAIEKGRIDPSLGTLKRLLEACGVSMSEFFRNENNASIVTEAHRINTVSTGGVHMRYLAPSAPGKLLQITQEIYDAGADTGTKPLRHEGQEGVSSSAAFSNCSWETSGIRSGPATATTSTARRRTGCATSGKSRARSSMRPRHPPSSVVIAPESCGRDA